MTIINKIIDGKMYAQKLLGEIHPLSKGFLNNFNRKISHKNNIRERKLICMHACINLRIA